MAGRPLPPVDLANRVGVLIGPDGSFDEYVAVGRSLGDLVLSCLPEDWDWHGKRVLDFGCGAGRTLRHLVDAAGDAELWGCDIDAPSIAWINANLSPPLHAFVNREQPPLARPDQSFDLIYAFSVFTHITDEWSAWLLELHRLLRPGGVLIASFLGAGMTATVAGEEWSEERIGMNALRAHRGWDEGGPLVLMSPWWIREHWGRAFEIERLEDAVSGTQGLIVARPRPQAPSRAELERIDAEDPREVAALRHNIRQLQAEAADLDRAAERYRGSFSWRVTAPVRRLGTALRARLSKR